MTASRILLAQRIGVVLLGLVMAVAMGVLGLWQAQVYQSQGQEAAERRVAEPARSLSAVAPVGAAVTDGYGRTVTMTGSYRPELELQVRSEDGTVRVLTAFEQPDGSLVPVVRGVLPPDVAAVPPAPAGVQTQSGLLLPSEDREAGASGPGELGAVRLQALAQTWPGRLINGYVTLAPADAGGQGMVPAAYLLPEAQGRLRNGAYALQWWVFAAFAIGMGIKISHDLGRRGDEVADPEAPREVAGTTT